VGGRFVSRDPIGFDDGINLYKNNFAIRSADPNGTFEVTLNNKFIVDDRYIVTNHGWWAIDFKLESAFGCDENGITTSGTTYEVDTLWREEDAAYFITGWRHGVDVTPFTRTEPIECDYGCDYYPVKGRRGITKLTVEFWREEYWTAGWSKVKLPRKFEFGTKRTILLKKEFKFQWDCCPKPDPIIRFTPEGNWISPNRPRGPVVTTL
jgi:hypothetical protein